MIFAIVAADVSLFFFFFVILYAMLIAAAITLLRHSTNSRNANSLYVRHICRRLAYAALILRLMPDAAAALIAIDYFLLP